MAAIHQRSTVCLVPPSTSSNALRCLAPLPPLSFASLHSRSKLQERNPAVGRSIQTTRNCKSLQQQAKMVDLVVRNHVLFGTDPLWEATMVAMDMTGEAKINPRSRAQGRRATLKLAAIGEPWARKSLLDQSSLPSKSKVLGASKCFNLLCKARQAACSGMKHTP